LRVFGKNYITKVSGDRVVFPTAADVAKQYISFENSFEGLEIEDCDAKIDFNETVSTVSGTNNTCVCNKVWDRP
jgi:hypothetical protein